MPNTTNAAAAVYTSPIEPDLRLRARDPRRPMRAAIILTVAVLACGMADPTTGSKTRATRVTNAADPHFAIPISLLEEHAGLYSGFEAASRVPGETGRAARHVAALLVPHFAKEQRVAYPLLRPLPLLVDGKAESWMAELLPLAAQLRTELQALRDEHVAIGLALNVLKAEAWAEGHSQYAFLAERLRRHIQTEEEVLFPAALVTAEYLRGRLQSVDGSHSSARTTTPASRPPVKVLAMLIGGVMPRSNAIRMPTGPPLSGRLTSALTPSEADGIPKVKASLLAVRQSAGLLIPSIGQTE